MQNKIPKLNEQNEVIGETTISEAVANGWPRRIVRIFIFDGEGSILLQRRSNRMKSYPGLWDQAVGGHVDVGESNYDAAIRELSEELGINNVQIHEIQDGLKNMACFDTLYSLKIPKSKSIEFDSHEVDEVQWFTLDDFEQMLLQQPDEFVPPFVKVWKEYRNKLII